MTSTVVTPVTVHPNLFGSQRDADRVLRAAIARGDITKLPEPLALALDAGRRLDTLAEALRDLAGAHINDVVNAAVHAVLNGEDVNPQGFEDEQVRAVVARMAHENDLTLFTRMNDRVRDAWRDLLAAHADTLLDGLRDQLRTVLTEAGRLAADLGVLDRTDLAAVVDATADQRAALVALPSLGNTYARIRIAQRAVLAAAFPGNPATTNLQMRESYEPSWLQVFETGAHESPDFDAAPLPPVEADPVTRLLTAVDREAWLPTVDELLELGDRISSAIARRAEDAA